MKKLFCALLAASLYIFLGGCAGVVSEVNGGLYTNVQGPVAYGENGAGQKTGEACAASYLGIVALGDASISTAMKNGGISNATSIDHTSKSILIFYAKYCTVVKGS